MDNRSTDPRLNVVPDNVDGYCFLNYGLEEVIDWNEEKRVFGEEALKNGWTRKVAEDLWDAYGRRIAHVHEVAQKRAEESQFAKIDNKLNDIDGYTLTPEEAACLRDKYTNDPKCPYWDESAPSMEREKFISLVQRLDEIVASGQPGTVAGYYQQMKNEKHEQLLKLNDNLDWENRHKSSNGIPADRSFQQPDERVDSIGYGEQERKSSTYGTPEEALEEATE
jgi:hypothetical protein